MQNVRRCKVRVNRAKVASVRIANLGCPRASVSKKLDLANNNHWSGPCSSDSAGEVHPALRKICSIFLDLLSNVSKRTRKCVVLFTSTRNIALFNTANVRFIVAPRKCHRKSEHQPHHLRILLSARRCAKAYIIRVQKHMPTAAHHAHATALQHVHDDNMHAPKITVTHTLRLHVRTSATAIAIQMQHHKLRTAPSKRTTSAHRKNSSRTIKQHLL